MEQLVDKLQVDYPQLHFVKGAVCCWSPKTTTITYVDDETDENTWGLLHETGHALLHHQDYRTDIDLLSKEVAAWQKAGTIGQHYDIEINSDHIQKCLDTYRDWLHKRSTCPACKTKSTPLSSTEYRCFNCHATWSVTPAQHHRPYRKLQAAK